MPWRACTTSLFQLGSWSPKIVLKFQQSAGIFKQSMGTRNWVGIGLQYCTGPPEPVFVNLLRHLGMDSQPGGPVRQPSLLYRLARLHRLAESIPGLLKRLQIRAQATLASGIGSLESIPGLLKRLQTRAQAILACGIGSLESIYRLHNMKNEDEDNFFWSKRIYSSLNYQREEE